MKTLTWVDITRKSIKAKLGFGGSVQVIEKQNKVNEKKNIKDFKPEKLKIDLKPYYFSNIITRCSKTMIECNNSKLNFKSTGTEG